jgi:hypothetical protein
MAGYDTAGSVLGVYASAHSVFGADPNFWLRYFSPSPYATVVDSDMTNDCLGVWDSGGHYLGPISAPVQTRLAGSAAEGSADAETFCTAIYETWLGVGPLDMPSNGQLYCWLDQEAGSSLSVNYWTAWAEYVGGYDFNASGTLPLYPCLYCDPPSPYPNCSTLAVFSASAVWSSEPESCSWASLTDPPSWQADSCSTVTTEVWQYVEQGPPGDECYSADVDLDYGHPGFFIPDYCMNVSSAP